MIRLIYLITLVLATTVACSTQKDVKVSSPNGKYEFTLNLENEAGKPMYNVSFDGKTIVQNSALGYTLEPNISLTKGLKVDSVSWKNVNSSWKPVYGEKSQYPDVYTEAMVYFKRLDETTPMFNLKIRAYNEGVAFRYEFLEDDDFVVVEEETEFNLGAKTKVWVSHHAQGQIMEKSIAELDRIYSRPLLAQLENEQFVAIGEANLVDYARMQLVAKDASKGILRADLTDYLNVSGKILNKEKVLLNSGVTKTPWRYIIAGNSAGDILENNYLSLNLSEPNKIHDTSWIRPGKVLREVTLTTKGGYACVDFAKKHNMEYVLFDAGWYGNEYDKASDATTVTLDPNRSKGPLDLEKVIDYGEENGIDIMLYVNRRSLEKQLDDVLPFFRSWRIKAMKFGFVNVGPQSWTKWVHDAIVDCAHHNIMVDIHDEYRPTGFSRTYPNLMTQEGVRGEEERPSNEHTLKTMFVRGIAGASDNTICYFDPRVTEECSYATQLAKAVCIYSPWQFMYWYDRPEGSPAKAGGAGGNENFIYEVPELKFFDEVPTVWHDTKVLYSEIGKLGVVARKSENDWYVGAINGTNANTVDVNLDFLDVGKEYTATIYYDNALLKTKTNVAIEVVKVKKDDVLTRNILANNGFAISIKLD